MRTAWAGSAYGTIRLGRSKQIKHEYVYELLLHQWLVAPRNVIAVATFAPVRGPFSARRQRQGGPHWGGL